MKASEMNDKKRKRIPRGILAVLLLAACIAVMAGCGFYKPDDSVKLEPVAAEDPEPLPEFSREVPGAAETSDAASEEISGSSVRADSDPEGWGKEENTLIVCMGDSITYGTGTSRPSIQSYPAVLKKKLGAGYRVRNLGRPGYTLTESTYCYVSDPAYEEALTSQADAYLFMLGTNDAYDHFWDAEKYRNALLQVISDLRAASPDAEIWLITPPHCFLPEGIGMVSDYIIGNEIVPIIRETAREEDTGLIDLYTFTEGRQDLFTDDLVHPNQKGYYEFAEYISQIFSANISL